MSSSLDNVTAVVLLAAQTMVPSLCVSLSYLLTPWSRVLLEKLTVLWLFKKFPAFYGTRRFVTAFTVRHLSLSWASPIQSIPPNPTSWRSIIILYSYVRLGLPSGKCLIVIKYTKQMFQQIQLCFYYTGGLRKNLPYLVRTFLTVHYTDVTENICMQSWTLKEIAGKWFLKNKIVI
jgi:hypothetical protein